MLELKSPNGTSSCVINAEAGGRIESLQLHNFGSPSIPFRELILTRHEATSKEDPFAGGCFIMAPFCGRVRDGVLTFDGHQYSLPTQQGPHALHGTVLAQNWVVLQCTTSHAVLASDLGPDWPFEGTIHHEISLTDEALMLSLTLTAHQPMPAQIGWHPRFLHPEQYTMPFTAMLKRDEHGIPVDQLQSFDIAARGTFDDCFIPDGKPIVLHYSDFDLQLTSDCSHWVIFDQQRQTMCVEPQSGPPNGINDSPELLQIDDQLSRWFEIRWSQKTEI